jgi:hypothetical protein
MNKKMATWAVALAALACAGSLRAHHSNSMFDGSTPFWVKGTVVRYEPMQPHARITLEERKTDGQVQRWSVEGPNLDRLKRMGVDESFLKAGDVIEVCGFALKKGGLIQRSLPDFDGSVRPFIHGHVLVMPDGRMRLFGPYGKLDNCIRPRDTTQSWVAFLNTDPLARQAWCGSRRFVQIRSILPKAFVDEIDRLMANPCE